MSDRSVRTVPARKVRWVAGVRFLSRRPPAQLLRMAVPLDDRRHSTLGGGRGRA